MVDSITVTNQALAEIGTRSQITAFDDGSTEGKYAGLLYGPLRDFMLREGDYDFSLKEVDVAALAAPPLPWVYAYTYPNDALRIRMLLPTVYNALDPQPVEWNVSQVTGALAIVTKTSVTKVLYTFAAGENQWDALFKEGFVRLLSSSLDMALTNRLPFSKERLSEALSFAGLANLRDS